VRVPAPGIVAATDPVEIRFDGAPLEARPGEMLAAALTAAGHLDVRDTRRGGRRGVFCGMGACQDCLVTVDGVPDQRACMTPVVPGMTVRRQGVGGPPGPAATPSASVETASPDVLVVGGGPAGLSAALAARRAGASVVLLDERPSPGGQYFKQPGKSLAFRDGPTDAQFAAGVALIEAARAAGVGFVHGAAVWGAFAPDEIAATAPGRSLVYRPRRLVLAPGAYERAVPLPGWTLPGFMTTGAAQTLLRAYRVAPGRRVLLGGNGPLNLQVAAELLRAGVEVVALAELAPFPGPARWAAVARAMAAAPGLVRDGAVDLARLARARVRVLWGHSVVAAEGEGRVAAVTVARIGADGRPVPGTARRFEVDAVCVGFGFQPTADLSRALGCDHRFDAVRGMLVAARDDEGRTSEPAVFVAGDAGGLGGARIAQAQGFLAGAAAARDLGLAGDADLAAEVARRRRALVRDRAFQDALWAIYAAPRLGLHLADADTIVCRCEELTRAEVEAGIVEDVRHAGSVKRATRVGMGRCQGRYCGPLVVEAAARATGLPVTEDAFFAPRAPLKPVPIGAIAQWPPTEGPPTEGPPA
jgi:NADPH-dependent 2,4-dienoyl-CoA reductase/sulfur reductase-like enzyme